MKTIENTFIEWIFYDNKLLSISFDDNKPVLNEFLFHLIRHLHPIYLRSHSLQVNLCTAAREMIRP